LIGFDPKDLKDRLNNEEKKAMETLREKFGLEIKSEDVWNYVVLPTTLGEERVFVARRYLISLRARGYEYDRRLKMPKTRVWHSFLLYILKSYPYPDTRLLFKAPFRVTWVSPIFHPNIMNGIEAGDKGIVCWDAFRKTLAPKIDISSIVIGIKFLIENPNPDNPLSKCKEAAEWFKKHPELLKRPMIKKEL
jgi:ubiquitin-protein ligase